MIKAAVIFSGCGAMDGTEVTEAVLTILELERNKVEFRSFAPDIEQMHVVDHSSFEVIAGHNRNVFKESQRLSRGKTENIEQLKVKDFEILVLPGGYGVAKNLSNIAEEQEKGVVIESVHKIIEEFWNEKKPIGSVCFASTVIASVLKGITVATLTTGQNNELLELMEAKIQTCNVNNIVVDEVNKLVSTPAFMYGEAKSSDINKGIKKLVKQLIKMV